MLFLTFLGPIVLLTENGYLSVFPFCVEKGECFYFPGDLVRNFVVLLFLLPIWGSFNELPQVPKAWGWVIYDPTLSSTLFLTPSKSKPFLNQICMARLLFLLDRFVLRNFLDFM